MKQEVNDCISNLENHVHSVFALERVSGENFVYCPPTELYSKLDDYCDEVNFAEIRPPLLLKGPSGTGKTALMANWLHRREHGSSHTRGPIDEFLFWHAVGCSRQSLNTNSLIRRLILALQGKFELNRPVPRTQERLSWELPRFLELAAKKGKIIIVVDGIHRLVGNDGSEDSLSWLPLELPPNVRIILSVTDSSPMNLDSASGVQSDYVDTTESFQSDENKKSKILMELARRKLPRIIVMPLDGTTCRSLVMEYIQNTINTETSAVALGPYTDSTLAPNRPRSSAATSARGIIPGFLLFECHISALLKHCCGGNPMFLRLFLRCLHFVCSKGFSLWAIFDDWIEAQNVEELYHKILTSCESGFGKNKDQTQRANDLSLNAGGIASLKKLFPHHPAFKDINDEGVARSPSKNKVGNGNLQVHLQHGANEQDDAIALRDGNVALSKVVMNNLGDQESVHLERQAHQALHKAMMEAKSGIDNLNRNPTANTREALLKTIMEKIRCAAERTSTSENDDNQRSRAMSNDTSGSGDLMDQSQDEETIGDSSDEEEKDDYDDNFDNRAVSSNSRPQGSSPNSKPVSPDKGRPSDGFSSLPFYLRGGSNTTGLGELLGNALALLYVARQGLKEEELWKILSFLQNKAQKDTPKAREKRDLLLQKQATVRKYGELILKERAQFDHLFRSADMTRCGRLELEIFFSIVKRVVVDIQRAELMCLVDFVQQSLSRQKFSGVKDISSITDGATIDYDIFSYVLNKLFKKIKGNDMKQIMLSKEDPSPVDDINDNFDNFNVDHGQAKNHDDQGGLEEFFHGDGAGTDENAGGLGAVKEELLLEVLCSVGVLYSPENKVLILPSDSELFRKTIHDKYILPRGGGSLFHWHHLIIHYFRTQPNTLRKCEELPWHLKICRKWSSLKDTLVDLKTFDLMFNNDLKDELIEYWMLLTEGPLYTSEMRANMGGTKNNREENGLEDPKNLERPSVLKEIDTAIEQKISLKEVRKKLSKGLVQPFDIVEELNRSLEAWVSSDRPTPAMLHRTISQISSFLLEFAKLLISYPQIRRLGIDMIVFNQFGVEVSELKTAMTSAWNGSSTKDSGEEEQTDGAENAYFDGLQKQETVRFPTPQMVASNFYLYLRWIWIQFPWLALNLAARTERLTASNDLLDDAMEEESRQSSELNDYAKQLLRIWKVKKTDPTVQVFSSSLNRRLASIKPRTSLSSSLERNVDVSCNKLYDELRQPSHIAQVRLGLGAAQRDKFRRTFQQEVESTKNIPFSYHGVKSMKSGSLFPTYNAFLKESNKKKIESDLFYGDDNYDSDATSQKSLVKVKKRKPLAKFDVEAALKATANPSSVPKESTFLLTELDDEIRRMNGEEYLQSHRVDMAGATLIKDETDLEHDAVMDRISRMKSICNKLLIIQKEKERNILELEKSIILRQDSDTVLINEVQSGEALITSLHDRNGVMEKSVDEAKVLEDGYLSLIKALRLNPPYVESNVKSLEVEVALAEKQFEELCQHRGKLYHEGERIDKIKKQQLSERMQYFKNARAEIAVKKKQVQKELKHLKETLGGRRRDASRQNTTRRDKDKRDPHSPKHSDSSDESDASKASNEDISLTKPVMHFINAIVRKITYNDTIVKEGDTTMDDVKRRSPLIREESSEEVMTKKKSKSKGSKQRSIKEDPNSRQSNSPSPERTSRQNIPLPQQPTLSPTVGKKKFSPEQMNALRNFVKSLPEIPSVDASGVKDLKQQLQMAVQILFERTESNSLEEFIDRYIQGQSLLENLRSQQGLVDSRLAQLRVEHAELYAVWGEISFLADDQNVASEVVVQPDDGDQSGRYLDNQLFAKEVRMHHFQRLFDSLIHTISEVRTAVGHVMNLVVVNSKLLSGLPRSNPPQLNSDQDIVAALNWCEDRIIALNEALTMDANRTNTNSNEDNKPLAQRQTELAALIQSMVTDKRKRPNGHFKGTKKQQGGLSKVLINSSDPSTFVSTPRGVKIPPAGKIDKIFDSKMNKVISERDRQADLQDGQNFYARDPKFPNNEIQRFLSDGLDKSYTKNMSRQAKVLMNGRPGRAASYGMVLEELMNSRGQNMGFLSGKVDALSPQKKSPDSPVPKPSTSAAPEQATQLPTVSGGDSTASRSSDL